MEFGGQMSLFDMGSSQFKIDKPLRVVELFAGYGSQSLSLKYLGVPFEHWKISEWATKSIQAYKDIHFTNDTFDSKDVSISEIKQWLKGKISLDYSNPLSDEKIDKMLEKDLRTIYENMQITHNLGSVCGIKGGQLEIVDKDKYCYLLTYSFPCQDLSLAGKGAGMQKGSGTRSGLLWEVERILDELNETNQLPHILLMENVPQVHGENNKDDWYAWLNKLDELGYQSYYQDLNATNYGVPQRRERCFCVSVPKGFYYDFPKPFKLEKRLKDVLEKNVDNKYYLTESKIEQISKWNAQ